VTNFQRIGARKVFPCWDEPAIKATFTITITHSPKYGSWSNMPIKKTKEIRNEMDWRWTIFHTTPPISTYRIGIVLTPYDITDINIYNYENIIIHHRDTIEQDLKFTKMIIQKVTKYLKSKWKITEILPITSHVIIPSLIDSSIPNWGLICYK